MNLDTRKFDGWPSKNCRPIMRLKLEPAELSKKYRLVFEAGKDDLDNFLAAHFFDEAIGFVVLIRHENAPQFGTPIYVDSLVPVGSAMNRIYDILKLSAEDVNWTTG